jgi:hypothetical protein
VAKKGHVPQKPKRKNKWREEVTPLEELRVVKKNEALKKKTIPPRGQWL